MIYEIDNLVIQRAQNGFVVFRQPVERHLIDGPTWVASDIEALRVLIGEIMTQEKSSDG